MRPIGVGVPSGKVKMTLWEGTEDEQSFEVKRVKSEKPYVLAYGTKHYLTGEEKSMAKSLTRAISVF